MRTSGSKTNAKLNATQKTDRQPTTQSGELHFYSTALSLALTLTTHDSQLTQLTSGKDRSIYKSNEAFLQSFYRSRHKSILFYPCPSFPSANSHAKKGKTNITKKTSSTLHSIHASDSFPHPILSESYPF